MGATIYDQRTPLPAIQQQVTSRLSGFRYTARYRVPIREHRFIEGLVGVAPALFGTDHFAYSDGVTAPINKDERASEIDASIAAGWDLGTSEWLLVFGHSISTPNSSKRATQPIVTPASVACLNGVTFFR